MSQQRTRWPSSANATARFSVVVVLATPPFWLANAITLLVAVTASSDAWGNSYAGVFAGGGRIPPQGRADCTAGRRLLPDTPTPAIFGRVRALLDKRLIFVTGKGGVGKSTVATALGLVGARRGLRTIVVELAAQEHVQGIFEHHGEHFLEVELAPGLFTISIDPQHAMEEYLRVK